MDMDIQNGDIDKHQEFINFLEKLNMDYEEYMSRIGGNIL
jgi:ubiquinone biosynthesis protein UbiJ